MRERTKGVGVYHGLEGGGKFFRIDGSREFVQGGLLVVASVSVKTLAGKIDAQLGLG